ncbi:unnamed protein product [Caenorhabditis sp. 36 PRJEB53466]|nr:unnamed protein product [Caenorhabditis sp. 36 PRJEB53466]
MRFFIVFAALATVTLAADLQHAQDTFCDYCNKNWEEHVPNTWAEVTGYLNLACFQLDITLKPTCMRLVNSLPLADIFEKFRPKMVDFGNAVCDKYCN